MSPREECRGGLGWQRPCNQPHELYLITVRPKEDNSYKSFQLLRLMSQLNGESKIRIGCGVSRGFSSFLFETGIILVVPVVEDWTEVEAESAKTLR